MAIDPVKEALKSLYLAVELKAQRANNREKWTSPRIEEALDAVREVLGSETPDTSDRLDAELQSLRAKDKSP